MFLLIRKLFNIGITFEVYYKGLIDHKFRRVVIYHIPDAIIPYGTYKITVYLKNPKIPDAFYLRKTLVNPTFWTNGKGNHVYLCSQETDKYLGKKTKEIWYTLY